MVIDPLDGTTNFVKRLPHFSVSIAVRIKAVMKSPLFTIQCVTNCSPQTRGQGAQPDGYRLRCSNARDLDGTILATGFPYQGEAARNHLYEYPGQAVHRMRGLPVAPACCTGIWPTSRPGRVTVTLSCL